jgi:transcriptional regulator with XRE-family HTH domain
VRRVGVLALWCLISAERRRGRRSACPEGLAGWARKFDIFIYIDPGDLIREHRERLGLSQRLLALRAGTTQAAVSRIERGLTAPTWETLRALLLAMGHEPELGARRLVGRWDPVHMSALRERPPVERLELALSANRFAAGLRKAGAEASGG